MGTLIRAENVSYSFGTKLAVNNISLSVEQGEILGIVGESGSGKTTTGRMLAGLLSPSGGKICYATRPDVSSSDRYENLYHLRGATRRTTRREIQMIFQNPYASLDPKLRVSEIILEGVDNFKLLSRSSESEPSNSTSLSKRRAARAAQLLELVGLEAGAGQYYPHQFSGGQRQRISIARALAVEPKFLIADEAVSALDVSLSAGIINLLLNIRQSQNLTIAFISHDLDLVGYIADRVIVMHNGEVVEHGEAETVLSDPQQAYTRNLLNAVPRIT
jgi:oligopeptide transport system ATP-binding protein